MEFLTKIFKKHKKEEQAENKSNLMEPQIDYNDQIDLMAADPKANIDFEINKKLEEIEPKGFENQLIEDMPKLKKEEEIIDNPITKDAFNIPLQKETIPSIETLETETVNLQKTQKFCPDCKTPNDMLNKFCVSCGYNFK